MTYSDILLFTIDSTEELNKHLAAVIKSESALKVCNESATYYALASEGFTDKVKEYASAVWDFIKKIVDKIKTYIVNAYKTVRDFIAKKIAAIRAKFAKKEGGEAKSGEEKPAEAKPEAKATEAAGDFRYYVGANNTSAFDYMTKGIEEMVSDMGLENMVNELKQMSDEEIAETRKDMSNEEQTKASMKRDLARCISTFTVNKVPADKYSQVASTYVSKYNATVDKVFKILGDATRKFEAFANSLKGNTELSSEQISFAKFCATKASSLISKSISLRSRATSLDLGLVPASGFISEEAAKAAFEEYKPKMMSIYD